MWEISREEKYVKLRKLKKKLHSFEGKLRLSSFLISCWGITIFNITPLIILNRIWKEFHLTKTQFQS